jgi:hypothetical protein
MDEFDRLVLISIIWEQVGSSVGSIIVRNMGAEGFGRKKLRN